MIFSRAARNTFALALTLFIVGCASSPRPDPAATTLAPTGTLRIGVYVGSPTSLVRDKSGEARGLSVELGQAFAKSLGVPAQVVEFPRLAAVLEDLKAGNVDFTITNATPVRAQDMNFSETVVSLELGYLALPQSRLDAIEKADQPGMRIGVTQGSSSQAALTRLFKQAKVIPAPTLQAAAEMLKRGELDAFATNKAILNEMADGLPNAKILPGRWGVEHLAIAIPKGREAAMTSVQAFVKEAQARGWVKSAAERAGLRGTLPASQ